MSDLQLTEDRDVRGGPGPDGTGTAALRRGPVRGGRARSALAAVSPAALWRRHKLFTFLVILSLLVRVLATRAFRPALLTADSFLYMKDAVQGTLGVIRPSGYSFFLHALLPLHRLLVVTTLQHLMGVAIAAIVYGLLRYHGLPFWGATLAAVPTLFDTRQIALESFILPDTLYCFVIVVAVALLLTKSTPRLWQCGVAGLLLGYAAVLRGNGLPVIVIAVVFMIIRRVGWRALAAGVLAAVIPVAGYVAAYHATYGQYNITSSDGIFLWSRTTTFADCAIIKPPADLKPLCPNLETSVRQTPARAWSVLALLNEPTAADYLWAPDAWWRTDSDPGINAHNDKLGQRFAIAAIRAQPLDYLRAVGRDIALVFITTDRPQEQSTMTFTQHPHIGQLPPYYAKDLKRYAHTTQNTHAVQPYAYFLFLYQQPVIFGGLLFLFAVLAGLVGMLRSWRRWGGLQALPWVIAAVSIVLPAMLTQSLYRYTIVAIPLACLAAGMAFIRPAGRVALAAAGPEAAWAGTGYPGPGTGGEAAGAAGATVGAGAVTGTAAGAAETSAWPGPAGQTAEMGALAPDPADGGGAPDVWAGHAPAEDVWAPGRAAADPSAWPVPGAADPDAASWATPPSGTPVAGTSAWAAHETAAHEATAPEAAAHGTPPPGTTAPEAAADVAAPELAASAAAAQEAPAPEAAGPEPAAPEPPASEWSGPEPEAPEAAAPEPPAPEAAAPEPPAPGAADVDTPGKAVPHPDTSAWAVPPAAPRTAAPAGAPAAEALPAEPPATAGAAQPAALPAAEPEAAGAAGADPQEPDPAISAWLAAGPPAAAADTSAWAPGPAPQGSSPAAAVPDEADWEDSLWEKPAPRTSAPLQMPPGSPAWQTPTASTPAWQVPAAAGAAAEPGDPAGADAPAASPSGAAPPAVSKEAVPPSQPPAESGPSAPVDGS